MQTPETYTQILSPIENDELLLQDNVRLQNAVDNLAELAPDVVLKPALTQNSWDGISTLFSSMFGFWNCGKQIHASSSSSSLSATLASQLRCVHPATVTTVCAVRYGYPRVELAWASKDVEQPSWIYGQCMPS